MDWLSINQTHKTTFIVVEPKAVYPLTVHSKLPPFIKKESCVLAYITIDNTDILSPITEQLTYIRGQKHVYCTRHQFSLISSTNQLGIYNCGKDN